MADDTNENVGEGSRDAHETTGWFRRVKRCLKDEIMLFARCACSSVSPDRLSAFVFFLVLFAISFTFTVSRYVMQASQPERFPNYYVQLLSIVFEVSAAVCLGLMWRYPHKRSSHDSSVEDGFLLKFRRFMLHNMKLLTAVQFYFAIPIFDIIRLIADGKCIDARMACDSGVVHAVHITDLISPVVRSAYFFIVFLFCIKFNEAHFFQNTLLLFGLAIVQAANMSTWLDVLLDESEVFSSERNWTYQLAFCFNETDVKVSNHTIECFTRTTDEYKALESARPFLYVYTMEYLMLVIECVVDWFFGDARRHDGTTLSERMISLPQERVASMTNDADGGTEQPTTPDAQQRQQPQQGAAATVIPASSSDSTPQCDAEDRQDVDLPLIDARPTDPTTSTNVSQPGHVDDDVNMTHAPQISCGRWWLFIIFILVILPPTLLLTIFFSYYVKHPDDITYRIVYWLFLSLAALVGYAASRRFPSRPISPTGFEYFVIFSCIGPILQIIFTIVANVHTDGSLVPTEMYLMEEVTNIVQIFSQVVFYAHAKSIRMLTLADNETVESNCREISYRRLTFMCVILYFAFWNMAIWGLDTHKPPTSWQKQYSDNWPIIYNLFNPLSLVFRFNSFFLFWDVFLRQIPVHRTRHAASSGGL